MNEPRSKSLWRKDVIGWSLYDFANTIYSMNIVSLYLKRYIVEDLGFRDAWYDIPYAISMLIAALLLPVLGALSDYSTKKKLFVLLFTLTCCSAVGLLAALPPWAIYATVLLFIMANFGYEASQPFYNALLYSVAEGKQARFISGTGVALGYAGSIVGMLLVLPFVTGDLFGIEVPFIEAGGRSAAFLPTALIFLLFALPLVFWVKEKPLVKQDRPSLRRAYRDVWDSIRSTRKYPGVLRFLIADYFVEDAVATVIINIGIYCSIVLGFAESDITLFLIISTVSAVVGSFAIGHLATRFRLKSVLQFVIGGWFVSLVLFVSTSNPTFIWILGSCVGILLGGLWTTTRPYLAEMVPKDELGRFFGLFALSGRAAAVIGPLLWTAVVFLTGSDQWLGQYLGEAMGLSPNGARALPYRAGVIILAVMMLVGWIIFQRVPHSEERRDA